SASVALPPSRALERSDGPGLRPGLRRVLARYDDVRARLQDVLVLIAQIPIDVRVGVDGSEVLLLAGGGTGEGARTVVGGVVVRVEQVAVAVKLDVVDAVGGVGNTRFADDRHGELMGEHRIARGRDVENGITGRAARTRNATEPDHGQSREQGGAKREY